EEGRPGQKGHGATEASLKILDGQGIDFLDVREPRDGPVAQKRRAHPHRVIAGAEVITDENLARELVSFLVPGSQHGIHNTAHRLPVLRIEGTLDDLHFLEHRAVELERGGVVVRIVDRYPIDLILNLTGAASTEVSI